MKIHLKIFGARKLVDSMENKGHGLDEADDTVLGRSLLHR
jgi:hypothetical protein